MKNLSIADMKIGQVIQISPTCLKPPANHTKKLKRWESSHYKAEITEINYNENSIVVKNKDNPVLYAVMSVVINLDRKDIILTSIN